jgi:DNA-binding FrmR family transcriptional regulator
MMSDQKAVHTHENHEAVLNRLARIEGHVRGIKRLVEEDTPCPEVLVQIAAVRSALNSVGQIILEDHLRSCMVKAVHDGEFESAMRDLKNSLDRFIG